MEKENIQKELFEFEAPRKQPSRFRQLFQKTDLGINLSAERIVFLLIGIIMLLVLSFALGVEKGKTISGKAAHIEPVLSQAPVQSKPAYVSVQQPAAEVKKIPVKLAADTAAVQSAGDKSKPYTIVAGAYLKESSAYREVSRLKSSGLEGFVFKSDPYYLACVGSFADKDSAQKSLKKVKQTNHDAYVRLK